MTFVRRTGGSGGGLGAGKDKAFRCKDGPNVLRIMTFDHVVQQRDIDLGRYNPVANPVGSVSHERSLPFAIHFVNQKPAGICSKLDWWDGTIRGDCPQCTQAEVEMRARGPQDRAAWGLRRNLKQVLVVVDLTDPREFRFFEASNGVLAKLDAAATEQRLVAYQDRLYGLDGVDVEIRYTKNCRTPNDTYRVSFGDPSQSRPLSLGWSPDWDPFDQESFVHPSNRAAFSGAASSAGGTPRTIAPKPEVGVEVAVDFGGDTGVQRGRVTAKLPNGSYKVYFPVAIDGVNTFEVGPEEIK